MSIILMTVESKEIYQHYNITHNSSAPTQTYRACMVVGVQKPQ